MLFFVIAYISESTYFICELISCANFQNYLVSLLVTMGAE